jgi:hypothetical protein
MPEQEANISAEKQKTVAVRILRDIRKSMVISTDTILVDYYQKTYSCTLEELLVRHKHAIYGDEPHEEPVIREVGHEQQTQPDSSTSSPIADPGSTSDLSDDGGGDIFSRFMPKNFRRPSPSPKPKQQSTAGLSSSGTRDQDGARAFVSPDGMPVGGDSKREQGGNTTSRLRRGSIIMVHRERACMKDLLEVSQALFSAFVSQDDVPAMNPVCMKFWGAIDDILRVSLTCSVSYLSAMTKSAAAITMVNRSYESRLLDRQRLHGHKDPSYDELVWL